MNYKLLIFIALFFCTPDPSLALTSDEVVILANKNAWHSIDLGKYYMKKRGIPDENILKLWTTGKETVSRENYEKQIAAPIKKYLADREKEGRGVKCLVLMFGLPLKINPPEFTKEEQKKLAELRKRQENTQESLDKIEKDNPEHEVLAKDLKKVAADIKKMNKNRSSKGAALESELSLLLVPDYPLAGWITNPLFIPFQKRKLPVTPENIMLVSRLDGPSNDIVRRIIDDSIVAEKNGLHGVAYFDARYKAPAEDKVKDLKGYGYYDWSIHQTAAFFRQQNIMPEVLDDNAELFQKGEAPNAAIYCGWYSLGKYVDAFKWQPGAVGFHIASIECASLKNEK